MYRVEVSGAPNGSEWDIQPSAFPTYDLSFQFALGIGKTILAMSGGKADNDLALSIIGPDGPILTWPLDALGHDLIKGIPESAKE